MRILNEWYGLLVILFNRLVNRIIRQTGEAFKKVGRSMVLRGEDNIPRWGRELFSMCRDAEVEVRMQNGVCRGRVRNIYQEFNNKESQLVVVVESPVLEKSNSKNFLKDVDVCKFVLSGHSNPFIINESKLYCVWAGFEGGHITIFFSEYQKRRYQQKISQQYVTYC